MDVDESNNPQQDVTDYSTQFNRWLLKPMGAWPSEDSTPIKDKVISIILAITCYSLIVYALVPCILNILFEETDMHKKITTLGPLSHWSIGGVNYFFLLIRSRDINRCVQHMRNDWRTVTDSEDRGAMMRYAKVGRFVAGLCAIVMPSGVIAHTLLTGTTPVIVHIGNKSVSTYLLPCPSYTKFVDTTKSPAFEITLILQLMSSIIVTFIRVGTCSLAAVFATHACGQLTMLMRWLDQLENRKKQNTVQHRLGNIVEHHLKVLSFVAQMEALMNQLCFVEVLGCTFDLCLLGYYIITGWNVMGRKLSISYVIIYVGMAFNIFILCYIGEIVTEQCKQVGETAYMTNWYDLAHTTARDLILIISRSSTVTKLTAGKLVHLSISTFGDVMKTSMAYLNMLRTMTAS
ncbi:odorant receptor 4 isoform X2 [Solenopsis invicta]|uniref:odorant receptor 4 isoform X2 n=1 Tax=Solenopsis invicta TaxID=13686 RepID=UPI000E33DC3B|nr:odorant receptor 4 isoform X2 [Solenopsis invicta]